LLKNSVAAVTGTIGLTEGGPVVVREEIWAIVRLVLDIQRSTVSQLESVIDTVQVPVFPGAVVTGVGLTVMVGGVFSLVWMTVIVDSA